MRTLAVGVLGPVAVTIDGVPIPLTKPRHREILSLLVVGHGRTVSTESLVEDLWEDPPSGAVGAIRTFIGELRRLLEPGRPARAPAQHLLTDGIGYAFRPGAGSVDVWRVEHVLGDVDRLPLEDSEKALTRCLTAWRGEAYEEFAHASWAVPERARIAELHARVVELLAAKRLDLGRPAEVISLLNTHVTDHSWREEGWRLLALALYQDHRQAEALTIIRSARGVLRDGLGLDLGARLGDLEHAILHHDPALRAPDHMPSLLVRTARKHAHTGPRTQLESVTALLPPLATSGAVASAAEERIEAITTAQRFHDPDLLARVVGGYDVPAVWTRSDDPHRAAFIVGIASQLLTTLPDSTSPRVRARLLATVAMQTRGTSDRLPQALEAEQIARSLRDPQLLCYALTARYMQSFEHTGLAHTRDAIGEEVIEVAADAELPTFTIAGHLLRMQALSALDQIPTAAEHAAGTDQLADRFDRPLARVFTSWFRHAFQGGPRPMTPAEMPGFTTGLTALADLARSLRDDTPPPSGSYGPYEPWARPHVLIHRGDCAQARALLDRIPDPPHDLLLEATWVLIGHAAVRVGHERAAHRARSALRPAAHERAAGSGVIDLGPVASALGVL